KGHAILVEMHHEDAERIARDLLGLDAEDLAHAMRGINDEIADGETNLIGHRLLSKKSSGPLLRDEKPTDLPSPSRVRSGTCHPASSAPARMNLPARATGICA